jgi:hypothetical protein
MPPTRLTTTPSVSPFITTSSTPYSAFRLERGNRPRSGTSTSGSDRSAGSSPSPSPRQIHSPQKDFISSTIPKSHTRTKLGHKTTPSTSDLASLSSVLGTAGPGQGLKKGHRRIRSKKLQAKLANNALCHGFEENVAACILVELR